MRERLARLSQRKTLINVGALFSGASVGRLLSAVAILIVARQLGVEGFGAYAAAISLTKLTSVLFSLGLDSWLLRTGARDEGRFASAIGANLLLKLVLGLLWIGGIVLLAPLLNQETFPRQLLLLSAVMVWLEELTNTGWSAFKSSLRNKITVWLMIGTQLLVLLVTLALVLLDAQQATAFMAGRLLAFALGALVALLLARRYFGIQFRRQRIGPALRETAAFALSHGLAVIYERADVTIIAYALGTMAAGLYSPAVSLMTTLFLIPLALYEVMLPVISGLHARDPRAVRSTAFRLFLGSAALGVVLGLGMSVIAHPLVWLVYGPEYAPSGAVLTVLSGVLVFKCVSFGLAAVLAAVGWQPRRVLVQLVAALFNVVVNLLIVARYGIMGVAYIYVLTEFLLMAGYLGLLLRWQRRGEVQPLPSRASS